MIKNRVAAALLVGAFALAVSGCSSSDANDPVIWYDWSASGPSMSALLTTKLELNDGCLMGSDDQYLAFPRDFGTWNADTNTLTYGGKDYAVGDTINAPGGGGATLPKGATVPAGCDLPADASFWMIQSPNIS